MEFIFDIFQIKQKRNEIKRSSMVSKKTDIEAQLFEWKAKK